MTPKKNLIYFTLGYNPSYVELTKFCIHTLKIACPNLFDTTDLLVLCDETYSSIVKQHLPFVKIHITERNDSAVSSSMRKLEIFDYADIDSYRNIMYLDSDIVVLKDLNDILKEELEDDLLYVKKETDDVEKFRGIGFGLCAYTEDDINRFKEQYQHPFNAGHFLFKNTPIIMGYFRDIRDFISKWRGKYFYEQSFLNHYFQLNTKYNDVFLDDIISFYDGGYNINPNMQAHVIHCLKENMSWDKKLQNMKRMVIKKNMEANIVLHDTRDELPYIITLPSRPVIAEIGVFRGEFARILYNGYNPSKLVLVDPYQGYISSGDKNGNNVEVVSGDDMYDALCKEYEGNSVVEIVRDFSTVLSTHDDNAYDLIYIDGDHSYEGVKIDLDIAYDKVKNQGWICGHDFDMNPAKTDNRYDFGVQKAVIEFIIDKGLKIDKLFMDGCTSYAIKLHKFS